jgi:hypothetical protein
MHLALCHGTSCKTNQTTINLEAPLFPSCIARKSTQGTKGAQQEFINLTPNPSHIKRDKIRDLVNPNKYLTRSSMSCWAMH